jgi:hypothetical protein
MGHAVLYVTPSARSKCFAEIPQRVEDIRQIARNQRRSGVVDLWKSDLAFNTIRVQRLPQPLQAGGIVGKLGLKVADGVLNCLSYYEVPKLSVMDLC